MSIWIYLILFLVLMFLDVPISFSMMATTALYCIETGSNFSLFANTMSNAMASFTMLAIPTFIFVGSYMNLLGFSDDIFAFAKALVGHLTGGLAHANVLASMIFAGMSGSAIADAGGLGSIEVKAMTDAGYDDGFSAAITASSAGIGPIIPPSISFVIYGSMASVPILTLFMAGMVPGILMGLSLMIMCYIMAKRHPDIAPKTPKQSFGTAARYGIKAIPALGAPALLLGGMSGGMFTATEGGVMASVYVVLLSIIYRRFSFKCLRETLLSSVTTTTMVLFMMGAGQIFNNMITTCGLMDRLLNGMMNLSSPFLVLLALDAILLFEGCFMGGSSILILMTPFIMSLSLKMGFNLVHLGVVLVLTTMIGGTTPPMAPALFTTCKCCNVNFEKALRPAVLLLIPLGVLLLMITFIPPLSTMLPTLLNLM
ncbi:TRAP transporter large permease [Enterocloster aldenensis]|uniref:TRAP transporter large permease n=1 Tax=Enterocloster aldenensis TaxID=358742 RepID=UPI000E50B478|nr:TRAP transporter large permease [Enterocloster aldenensis]